MRGKHPWHFGIDCSRARLVGWHWIVPTLTVSLVNGTHVAFEYHFETKGFAADAAREWSKPIMYTADVVFQHVLMSKTAATSVTAEGLLLEMHCRIVSFQIRLHGEALTTDIALEFTIFLRIYFLFWRSGMSW